MPDYLRAFDPGGTFFFTLVTERRMPILTGDLGRRCLSEAIRTTLARRPVKVEAMVLLPDHLHAIWTMPEGDSDYSSRWATIKRRFVRTYLEAGGDEQPVNASRVRHRRRGVWQRKFWEHSVRAEEFDDIAAYIHFNPVKHGLTKCPHEWAWSTFHQWVGDGRLRADWECACDTVRRARPFAPWYDQCE
jgi:putative transposase